MQRDASGYESRNRQVKQTISLTSRVAASPEQVSCDLAGEAVMLNLKNGVYYGLDPVGARIWSLIQEPRLVREIRDTVLDEYDVDAEQCEHEVLTLLSEMAGHGLIEVDGTSAP